MIRAGGRSAGGGTEPVDMTNPRASIDQILTQFFAIRPATGAGLKRLRFLDPLLRRYLETEGSRTLTTPLLAELAIERGVEPAGAFARIMNADDLIYTLPGFLEPPWLQENLLLRKAQIDLVAGLAALVTSRYLGPDDFACALMEVDATLSQARLQLREDRRAAQFDRQG